MFFYILKILTLIYVNNYHNEKVYNSGYYSMKVTEHIAFAGDDLCELRILTTVRPVENGFNITFHCRKNQLDINPHSNHIIIIYRKETLHIATMVHMTFDLHGGILTGFSMDELHDNGDIITIVRIRMEGG